MDIHTKFLLAWLSVGHLTGHSIIHKKDSVIKENNSKVNVTQIESKKECENSY